MRLPGTCTATHPPSAQLSSPLRSSSFCARGQNFHTTPRRPQLHSSSASFSSWPSIAKSSHRIAFQPPQSLRLKSQSQKWKVSSERTLASSTILTFPTCHPSGKELSCRDTSLHVQFSNNTSHPIFGYTHLSGMPQLWRTRYPPEKRRPRR